MAQQLDEFGIPIKTANTSAEVDEFGIPVKKNDQPESINSLDGTLNSVESKKPQSNDAFNDVVAKSQAGYINPDLEDFNKPQVDKQTTKKDTSVDDLVLRTKVLRDMRNASVEKAKVLAAEVQRLKGEGENLISQYKTNPSPELEQSIRAKQAEYLQAEKASNRQSLITEVYNRRLLETSDSIKKMANDEVPDGIYSAMYKGIKGSVKDTEKAIEMSRASKEEQIQWAKDESLRAPTKQEGNIEQGAEMIGGLIPDIATSIGFSLVGLPAVGVGAVSARQGAQQAGQDFVRAFNAAKEDGKNDDDAYEIATKAAGIGFATGAAEGLVGSATGHLGAKLASKAASRVTGKVIEKAVDTGLDATIAGTMQVGRNVFDRYQGLKTDISEGVAQNMLGEVLLSGPVNTFHGVKEYVNDRKKSTADIVEAIKEQPENPYKLQKLQENIEVLKETKGISDTDYKKIKTRIEILQSQIESGVSEQQASKVAEREEKKVELTNIIKDGDEALKKITEAPAETPFDKAEQEVLVEKIKESQKAAFEELKNIATEQIEEFQKNQTGSNANMGQPVGATENTGGNGVDPTAKEKGAESVGVKPDLEKAKLEKERLKTLVTAIEKGKPYDKKEVEFFNSDQSELFKKGGVPVELKVALESAKKEAPVTTERQESINKLVELADEYNKLWQGNKGRATESGRELLNRIRQKAKEGGFQIGGGVGRADVVIKNENGNPVRAKYASSGNSETVTDYIPLSEREKSVQDVFRQMSNFSIHSFPTVRNENGYRFSKAQMEKAVDDIKNDRHTVGAKRVLDALDIQVHDGEFKIEDPIYGNQTVSVQEYLDSFKEDFAEEKAIGTQEQAKLASEYDKWFSELTDEEKNKENEHNNIEFKSEAKGSEDAQNQTSSSTKADKTSSTTEGDGKESVKKESTVETNKNQSNDSKSKGKKTKREGLLGPGKKFYSYLVSQGMSKANAALNTALFVFSTARRAKLLGKSVEEVANEYDFSGPVEKEFQLPDGRVVKGVYKPDVVSGFYSPLQKIIGETKFDKLPAKQWLDKFGKGEEAKWTGLTQWLSEQNGAVTKHDIQEFLKENRVEVVEVVNGGEGVRHLVENFDELPKSMVSLVTEFDKGNLSLSKFKTLANKKGYEIEEGMDGEQEIYKQGVEGNDTKYSEHQLPGEKSNYKEVLVTMPSKQTQEQRQKRIDSIDKRREDLQNEIETLYKQRKDETKEYKDLVNENEQLLQERQKILYNREDNTFRSSHFDEPNILVHLRMNTRTDAEGKKVLFLEEVQSDWGQKGKKAGFKDDTKQKQWDELESQRQALWNEVNEKYNGQIVPPLLQQKINEVVKKQQELYNGLQTPSAPFVTDTNAWTKLALKTALQHAVKEGVDRIAWTTGTQQFDRWGSEEISWRKNTARTPQEEARIKELGEKIVNYKDTDEERVEYEKLARKEGGFSLLINEQTSGATAFNGQESGYKDDATIQSKEDLRKAIKKNLSRERNDAEIDKLTDRIWNRMQTEDSGTSLPRKEGMEEFYGNPTDMKRAKKFTIKKEGELFAVKDENGKTIRNFKQENEANKFKENYGLGIVGNIAKGLFKQEPKTTNIDTSSDVRYISNKEATAAIDQNIEVYAEDMSGADYLLETKEDLLRAIKNGDHLFLDKPPTGKESSTQHSIDVTPELKKQVREGLSLFQSDGDFVNNYRVYSLGDTRYTLANVGGMHAVPVEINKDGSYREITPDLFDAAKRYSEYSKTTPYAGQEKAHSEQIKRIKEKYLSEISKDKLNTDFSGGARQSRVRYEGNLREENGARLFQENPGAIRGSWSKENGKRILGVFGNAKNTTAVHEALGHDYLDTIIQAAASGHKESSEDIDVLVREFKKDNRHSPSTSELRKQLEEFDVESMDRELDKHAISIHEWFAKKAEEYMANPEMRGASPRLKTLLQKFVDYLKDLHNALAGRKVSEPLQKIFQKAFGEDYDIAKEAIDAEVKNVDEIADISTSATELFNNLLGISNKPTSENKLFDTDFDEARSKETLVALAQKLILDGVDVKDIIPSIKKMISESQASAEQKEFLSKLIDKSAADMILDPPVELGDNKATRRGIQKMLKDPNVPEVVKEQIRKKKDILEYKPITFAEGDAVADAAIRLYGLDVVDKWIKKMLRGNKPDQVYAARVYKKLLEAQTTLANKYAAEGNISMFESTLENWNLDIENAGELSTSVAQQLVMFRGVFGHPELAVRNIQKELTNTQKVKIAKRDKIREMLKEAYDKLEITNEDLLKNTFELEETNEQLRAKISELENETRVRSTPAKSLPKKTSTADNPKEAFEQRVAQLKQMRAARGLSDADSEAAVLKEATEFLFDMDQKAYSFVQYAKKMRAAVDDKLTDRELADAYKAVRDEQGLHLDGDEIIGSVIAKQIVKDEELAAAIQMNKAIASASKAKKDAIASAKKDVLSKLKEAGFKRGDHVDWKKIATERMQNPEKASAIIEDAVSSAGGLSASEKLHMKLDLLSKLDETIKEHKTKLVESILKENDVPTGKKNRGEIDRLVDILNTGDENSSPARLKEAVSKILGIESIKTKDLIRLRELGNSVQGETLRKERQKILQEMWFIQNKYSGSRYGRILADYYYANMLSGPITQVKNATNRFDIWKNVLGAMITSGGDKNIRQVLSGSKNKGIFADTLKSGISLAKTSLATDNFGNYGHVSELEHLEDKPYFEKSIGWLKYVSRTLDGIDGENWVRMYDQSQYRWMVDQFKSQGFTTEVSRQKAKDLMYPIKWDDAIAKAKQIYSQKGEKVSNATLKRAAYDIVQQMREKLAGEQGIDGMEEVGTALANWITFKGDAYGTFELIPTLAQASIKGFTFLNEAAGKIKSPEIRKPAQFIINATRIITIPFVNGVARVVERGFEAAGLGFLKAGFQYREAKKAEGIEQSIMMHQAKETLNSAIGGMVVNVIVMGGLTMASSMFYDKDEDKVKSGFYGSQIGKNPSINGGPRNVWRIFGMNIPVGFLGTQMIPAILAGTVGDYNRNKKLTGGEQKFKLGLAVAKSILEQSMFTSQSNFKEWVGDVVGNTVDEKTKQAIVRSTASTFGNLIPAKSFIQQSLQMYTNADDKEARTFVQNVVKYSFAGIGLDPRIDYLGRVVKTGKKNPESAAGVTEMFNDWGYDGRDKLIASFGSDFSIWNRSQKTLNYNEKPISDEKYYAFQRRANTIFGQYMRQYLPYIKAASVPKGILSDKSFKMSIVKDLHSLSNKQAMSEMNITGGSNQKILKESLDGQIMTIENSLK